MADRNDRVVWQLYQMSMVEADSGINMERASHIDDLSNSEHRRHADDAVGLRLALWPIACSCIK